MATYLIAWPDNSWSVMVTEHTLTAEELSASDSPIDMTDCPALATVFQVRMEDGEFLCDLPEHQKLGEPFRLPLTHVGTLRQVHAPSAELLASTGLGHMLPEVTDG